MSGGRTAVGRSVGRSVGLGRFAAASNLGRWLTRGGLAAGAAVMLLGSVLSIRRGAGWAFDPDMGFMGFFIMAIFTARSGLEEQRDLGLATFTRHNLASRQEHALGLVFSLLAAGTATCAAAFVAILVASAGDLQAATWYTGAWGLRLLVLLGFVPWVEAVASLRLPLILPVFAYWGLVMALTLALPENNAAAVLIPVERGDARALTRLGLQGAASFSSTSLLFVALTAAGPGVRLWVQRIVRFRH